MEDATTNREEGHNEIATLRAEVEKLRGLLRGVAEAERWLATPVPFTTDVRVPRQLLDDIDRALAGGEGT